jgi:hypothetical protein
VLVGLSRSAVRTLRQAHQPVPQPLEFSALIDTGAEITCVDSAVAAAIGLRHTAVAFAFANIPATGGQAPAPRYDVGLTVLHPSGAAQLHLVEKQLLVLEVPLAALGYEVLIGRDVLARCRFLYDGPAGRFRLAY